MKTLYFQCDMGAAGDMMLAALYELMSKEQKERFLADMNKLVPGLRVFPEEATSGGVAGTHMHVVIDGREEAPSYAVRPEDGPFVGGHTEDVRDVTDIYAIIRGLPLPEPVKEHARAVYDCIAEAESAVHSEEVFRVHFHEVGAMDAVADVTGVCYAMHLLSPDRVLSSPVQVGYGTVRCAHGDLPVPAPATEKILRGMPWSHGDIEGELCTPTGAALLKHFVNAYTEAPAWQDARIGKGLGAKAFPRPNVLYAMLQEEA